MVHTLNCSDIKPQFLSLPLPHLLCGGWHRLVVGNEGGRGRPGELIEIEVGERGEGGREGGREGERGNRDDEDNKWLDGPLQTLLRGGLDSLQVPDKLGHPARTINWNAGQTDCMHNACT